MSEQSLNNDYKTQIERLTEIGIALSAQMNLDVLLEEIVHHARELTHADAGTLYMLRDDELHFEIIQNESLGIFEGGTGKFINLPPVALSKSNVSAYCAMTGETVNIPDVYGSEEFDFTGPRKYDAKTGYRSKSMLVVPMKDYDGGIIGVLQLMNAKIPGTDEVTAFPEAVVDITRAFASQAAIAVSNTNLIKEIKALFESLIKVLAVAVDAKSKYTGNHVQRVAEFTMWLANAVNMTDEGPLKDVNFSENQIEEIRLAGWLHDVGKVTTPVWVMDKSTKLETILDRIELLKTRFALAESNMKILMLEKQNAVLREKAGDTPGLDEITAEFEEKIRQIREDCEAVERFNQPGEFMEDEKLEQLEQIAAKSYPDRDSESAFLTDDEKYNLSIKKGSLTKEEMDVMRSHVSWTIQMLKEVPFKGNLKNVPLFAGQHHEKLDGKGYPLGLKADDIPIQSRIIAIADFYEALSAKDRPYKKPMPVEKIISILSKAAEFGEIDSDILDLMIKGKVHEKFEKHYDENREKQ